MENPRLYATFLLWLLSELFEQMPEVGDLDKPKLVFFFDEAHLLFNDAPKALLDRIEQVVRLIRSKGVGVFFVTQNPIDVPDKVLGQLGNRVQHALRAFTPRDQKAVAAAAQTFRPNPKLDTAQVITELAKGEALVSFLEGNGTPAMVERVMVRPPSARIGPITPEERADDPGQEPGEGQVRRHGRRRVGLRGVAEARRPDRAAGHARCAGRPQGEAPAGGGWLGGIGGFLGGIFGTNRPRGKRLTPGQTMAREITRTRHQPGRRPDRRRFRQIDRRQDGRLGRPRDRARRARRHPAALSAGLFFRRLEADDRRERDPIGALAREIAAIDQIDVELIDRPVAQPKLKARLDDAGFCPRRRPARTLRRSASRHCRACASRSPRRR